VKHRCVFVLLILPSTSGAEVFELQALDFGTIAIISNDSVSSLTIDKFGNTIVSPSLRIVEPPSSGRFLIDNLAPNTGIRITMSHNATTMTPLTTSQEFFTFSLTDYSDYLVADGNGEAELFVGGTISTSGSGNLNFAQTDYRINYRVTFLF
jgi:hypothetical protein